MGRKSRAKRERRNRAKAAARKAGSAARGSGGWESRRAGQPANRRRATLEAFARNLRRETHVLSERPDLLWQQPYNRLQWSAPFREVLAPKLARMPGARTSAEDEDTCACAVSPDASVIVAAGEDCTLRVWEGASGEVRQVLEGHTDNVNGCAVSPDGAFVISGSADQTLRLWEAADGRELVVLPLAAALGRVAFDARLPLAACGDDGGNVYPVELVGVGHGPIVVTAVDRGGGATIRCPACLEPLPLEEGWLGQVIECPRPDCEGRMRVNPLVVRRPLRRCRLALWRRG